MNYKILNPFLLATILLVVATTSFAQNVGIGTTTPLQKLHVAGTAFVKDSLGIGIDTAKAKLDVKGDVLLRGNNTNSFSGPLKAAVELFVGRTSVGSLPSGLDAADMAFNFGGPDGGFRHFIATRHDNVLNSEDNAIEFYMNNSNTFSASAEPGTGNRRVLSVTADGVKIDSTLAVELGRGMYQKEPNAGKIGYHLFTPDALDIVGAGTNTANRKIKLWSEGGVEINGGITQDAVQSPSLLNSWVNHGNSFANAGFWKDKEGMVHIQGLIKDGSITNGTVLFVLPAGYRPSGGRLIFSVNNNNIFGRLDILPNGDVIVAIISSNAFINLTGISFRAN